MMYLLCLLLILKWPFLWPALSYTLLPLVRKKLVQDTHKGCVLLLLAFMFPPTGPVNWLSSVPCGRESEVNVIFYPRTTKETNQLDQERKWERARQRQRGAIQLWSWILQPDKLGVFFQWTQTWQTGITLNDQMCVENQPEKHNQGISIFSIQFT